MADVLAGCCVHDEHAPVAVAVGDVQVRLVFGSTTISAGQYGSGVPLTPPLVSLLFGPFAPAVPICRTNVPSVLNFRICESLPKFGAHGYCPWKLRAWPLPAT